MDARAPSMRIEKMGPIRFKPDANSMRIQCGQAFSEFVQPLRSLNVVVTEQLLLCLSTRLYCHGVLHLKHLNNNLYLVEKDYWLKHSVFY